VPPSIIKPDNSRVVTDEGTNKLIINCTATGIPTPNITWRDPNGLELSNDNSRINVEPQFGGEIVTFDGINFVYQITGSLLITNTNDSDSGVYTCVADNGVVRVDNNTLEVFVRGMLIIGVNENCYYPTVMC